MTLLCILILVVYGGVRLGRLVEVELEALEPTRAAAPHGWIDHNHHLS